MKKDKNNIETTVLKCFIRTIKSDGMYMLFRRGVNNTGIMKFLVKGRASSDSPFARSSSTNDVVATLEKITNDMAKSNGKKGGIKDLDRYEHVTMTINHLLHFFMEANGISMQKLCSMGEEIYNLSCNKLFGDTLEDLEKQEEMHMDEIRDIGQLKAKMFQDYINGIQSGKISQSVSFDMYLKKHKKEFDRLKSKNGLTDSPDIGQGYALGRQPDDNEFMSAINSNERAAWLDDLDLINDGHWA